MVPFWYKQPVLKIEIQTNQERELVYGFKENSLNSKCDKDKLTKNWG